MASSIPFTDHQPVKRDDILSSLPTPYPEPNLRKNKTQLLLTSASSQIPLLVILDDDPTGTQTCHDIPVLTVWDVETLTSTFTSTSQGSGFFILTNSRALHPPEAEKLIREICENLHNASGGAKFEVVLRSDSTLRGHFPLECEVAESVLGEADLWILAPFFLQGGRYTLNDVHYVAEGENLTPAGLTQFAKDASFGYKASDLREWVVEKSHGRIKLDRVVSLSLEDVRKGGPEAVMKKLMQFPKGSVVVVNAAAEEDMDIVVLGILEAAKQGKRFLYRSGAALVSARLGIEPIPPKSAADLSLDRQVGGLIVAGSYVPKTSEQLKVLREKSGEKLTSIVLQVEQLLKSKHSRDEVIRQTVKKTESEIANKRDVLIMTSRDLKKGNDERESLDIGNTIAKALVDFLEQLKTRPRYLIAKGGITSSDMATKGLKMKKAQVVGQAAPGVPLWECFEETCKWRGLPFIVFPGNVGGVETLYDVVEGWRI